MTPGEVMILLALIALFGVALLSRRRGVRASSSRPEDPKRDPVFPKVPPLQPGERYDTTVKLVTLPNGPLAELWCQRLREQGIEAFSKGAPYLTNFYSGAATISGLPAEIWVGQHDAARARELFPELG